MIPLTFLKRTVRRSKTTTVYLIAASAVMLLLNLYEIFRIREDAYFLLSSLVLSPSFFGITFSSLVISLFNDDRQSGLLEFLVSQGLSPAKLYVSYIYSFLLISIPTTIVVSALLGLLLNNLYYTLIILINAIGISWIVVPISLYISYFQANVGSSRSPLGTYIGYVILFSYIYLGVAVRSSAISQAMLYVGVSTLILAIVLTFVLGRSIKPDKLIA
ncbi:hypothetical protein [Sulfuracidifex tepidarius]|uniref:ABC-2 type transporter domain-containing protein n=1 Tax=Sulfuracidifex tepidarius TaxID=1294262 RepID=A0A510DUP6_9CREN|nr:hypothetical protein [Sulfuracidifex tepidarius]BBG23946.1 hypothetical protein IC006_1244 [Sulfuracidifex tepidarius]BBG26701.1 hypothetical protein IC007_1219 [Sulfuracidifex tepidarius]